VSRVNVFVFVMDFILEAPFKVLVEIAEQWTRYVRERKEDIE
jgi:predicted nuclease of restriction endonuclease-like RecB superfamily